MYVYGGFCLKINWKFCFELLKSLVGKFFFPQPQDVVDDTCLYLYRTDICVLTMCLVEQDDGRQETQLLIANGNGKYIIRPK